jgi:abscisic-aldehyde oxidase
MQSSPTTGRLTFSVNGERFSLRAADVDPTVTLKHFLTTRTSFKGPKLGCGEGGCGACVVDIARPADGSTTTLSIGF